MSTQTPQQKITIPALRARKGPGTIVSLTAYSTPMARAIDPVVDLIIVGDSLGMVLYGMENTLSVSLEMMIAHGKAVMRGVSRACVVIDLPFGSYQESPQQAYRNAARLLAETGADGVKLEGGQEMQETVQFLSCRGIPTIAHIGLKPQFLHSMGGYRAQGGDPAVAQALLAEAQAFQQAGAFALLLEGIVEAVAQQITTQATIPTIGIGASPACDGQVLVSEDLLGLFDDYKPRFVKRYAQLGDALREAVQVYAQEVREGAFPQPMHCFGVKAEK